MYAYVPTYISHTFFFTFHIIHQYTTYTYIHSKKMFITSEKCIVINKPMFTHILYNCIGTQVQSPKNIIFICTHIPIIGHFDMAKIFVSFYYFS